MKLQILAIQRSIFETILGILKSMVLAYIGENFQLCDYDRNEIYAVQSFKISKFMNFQFSYVYYSNVFLPLLRNKPLSAYSLLRYLRKIQILG